MKPYWEQNGNKIYQGHAPEILTGLELESVQCVVTSPPYWGLRDYGLPPMIWDAQESCMHEWGDELKTDNRKYNSERDGSGVGQSQESQGRPAPKGQFCQLCGAWRGSLGLEPTPELYIQHIVQIFREVKRVLRKDGTVWLNMGDSYASVGSGSGQNNSEKSDGNPCDSFRDAKYLNQQNPKTAVSGLKPKDLCGIPWRVALALQADGWWLRQDIIWSKPNPMPESVTDRCTKSHEYLFLLTKSGKYFFDAEAIREDGPTYTRKASGYNQEGQKRPDGSQPYRGGGFTDKDTVTHGRNKRSAWQIATHPMPDAHFATFPPKLVEPCILAGTSEKGCCPKCGAPWERVVEPTEEYAKLLGKGKDLIQKSKHSKSDILTKGMSQKKEAPSVLASYKTIGWKPTCNCYHTEPFPEYLKQDKKELDEEYEIRIAPIRQERLRLVELWKPFKTIPCTACDPFFGSGTVGIVAHKHGRNFTGIELSKTYLDDIAIPRIEKETAQLKLF